jgi:hypothetical protein
MEHFIHQYELCDRKKTIRQKVNKIASTCPSTNVLVQFYHQDTPMAGALAQ